MPMDRFYQLLNLNRAVRSHHVKFAGLLGLYWLRQRHLWLRFDPVMACNLRCQMCYFSDPSFESIGRFSPEEIELIAKAFFPWAVQMYVGGGTEPTMYNGFFDLIALAKKYHVPMVGMVTNGQLMRPEHLERLVELGLDELTLSTHGVERETYEQMMRRASFDKFLEVLDQLEAIKKRRGSTRPELRLNYTVNAQNLAELARFFDVYGKYTLRTLQVRPIVDLGNTECTQKDMTPHVRQYNQILGSIERTCRQKGIRLLANYEDVTYEKKTTRAALAPEVVVYLSPRHLSKQGFDWRHESYSDYCRRTHWSRSLLKKIFTSAARIEAPSPYLSYKIIDQ